MTRQPCAPQGIEPAVRNHQIARLNIGHCKNCIIGNGLYTLRESSQACLWRWLLSSQISLESISSPWGFSSCLMLISPTQRDFFSFPFTPEDLLVSFPHLLQPRSMGCVCRVDRWSPWSMLLSQCPGRSDGRISWFPPCLHTW